MELIVNGITYEVAPRPMRPLLHVLRQELGIGGVGSNCLQGHCGSCTVQVDGEAVRACVTPVSNVAGATIFTAAGVSPTHALPQSFSRHQLSSCDGCPAGQLMAAKAFLDEHPDATREEVLAAVSTHICDCLRYRDVHQAIAEAVEQKRQQTASPRRA
jgi:aerobic-type carbon monoxide dehydrogenase small subunit (CoxS/CutS family)